jgi:polysaccharide export outer membrane protein
MRLSAHWLIIGLALIAAGCTSFVPAAGPTVRDIQRAEVGSGSEFELIDVDDRVAALLGRGGELALAPHFPGRRAPAARIGPGDVLQISVWEPGGSGLFGPSGGGGSGVGAAQNSGSRQAGLQPVMVERDGNIAVPFAGRVHVAGLTADRAAHRIEGKLKASAIQPQVMVTVLSNTSHAATVGGEVNKAGLVPLSVRGDRLLDVVASAGGARFPAYETTVRLTRGRQTAATTLQSVIDHPGENLYVEAGDSIYLVRTPKSFTAIGAAGKVGHFTFEAEHITLAEAVAKAGGLIDNQADLTGVFLFRYEPAERLAAIDKRYAERWHQMIPVFYRYNWRNPDGIVFARRTRLADKDMVLVANAEGAQLVKWFNIVRGATGVVSDLRKNSTGN